MGKAFAITFGILVAVAAFIVYRTGYFQPVQISSGDQGPFILVYKKHLGPYHKIAPVIDSVEKSFKEKGLTCTLAFGRYLHDPDTVPHDRLESHGGCALTRLDEKTKALIEEENFQMEPIEKQEYLVAQFEGSPSIGPLKVYPYVEQWMKKYGYKQRGPVIELYQTTGSDSVTTRYLFMYE